MGTRKGRTNKLKNTGQMQRVFKKAILGEEQSPQYGFITFPFHHRVHKDETGTFRDNTLDVLCDSNNIDKCSYSSSHMVEWYPHTHDHSTLFSSITILQIMDTAREQNVSRAGHYTIRPPAGRYRGNPP